MYAGLMSSKQAADERNEASMNAPAKLEEAADEARVDKVATLPSFYQDDTPKSTLEQWQRLNNDPLFAVRQLSLPAALMKPQYPQPPFEPPSPPPLAPTSWPASHPPCGSHFCGGVPLI